MFYMASDLHANIAANHCIRQCHHATAIIETTHIVIIEVTTYHGEAMATISQGSLYVFFGVLLSLIWPHHSYTMEEAQTWHPRLPNQPKKFHRYRPRPFIHPNLIDSTNVPQPRPSSPKGIIHNQPGIRARIIASFSPRNVTSNAKTIEPRLPTKGTQRPQTALPCHHYIDKYAPPNTPGTGLVRRIIDFLHCDAHSFVNQAELGKHLSREAHFATLYTTKMTHLQYHYFCKLAQKRTFENERALAHALLKDPETICMALERYLHYYRPESCAWARSYLLPIPHMPRDIPESLITAHEYITTTRLGRIIPHGSFCNLRIFIIRFLAAAAPLAR